MKTVCEHGYYKFYIQDDEQLLFFKQIKKFYNLVPENDYYTFDILHNLKHYTIAGMPYGALPAIQTYAGRKEDCLRANKMVYGLTSRALVYLPAEFVNDDGGIVAGIPQVGLTLTSSKKIVSGFIADYLFASDTLKIIEWETV